MTKQSQRRPPEFTSCETHGARVRATSYLRSNGTPRVRCRDCHRDSERERRARLGPQYAAYMRSYRRKNL
jgi:hypothetical protein